MPLQKQARRFLGTALTTALLLSMTVQTGLADTGSASTATSTTISAPPAPGRPTQPPAGPAEPAISKEEALALIKRYFWLPEETDKISVNAYLTPPGGPSRMWDISVMVQEENSGHGFGIASVDATTGTVLRYTNLQSLSPVIPTGPQPALRPEAEARAKAQELLQALYPGDASGMVLLDGAQVSTLLGYDPYANPQDRALYRFSWVKHRDGIPFPDHRIEIAMDGVTLDVVHYVVAEMQGMTLPPGQAKLSAAAALELWKTNAQPQLTYMPVSVAAPFGLGRPTGEFKLVYQFGKAFWPINAMTGAFAVPLVAGPEASEPEPVPAGEVEPVEPAQLPLSDAAVLAVARALLQPGEGSSVQIEDGFRDYSGDSVYVRLTGDGPGATVVVDRRNGTIRNAWRELPMPVEQAPITPEREAQAREAAIALVQDHFSQLREEMRLLPGSMSYPWETGQVRQYSFQRYVNGVPVNGNQLIVSMDLSTLMWQNLNLNWSHEAKLPSSEGALSAAKAGEIFWQDRQPVLIYRPADVQFQPGVPWEQQPRPTEAQLVYRLPDQSGQSMVDALTGQLIGRDGRPLGDMAAALARISGHWAQGELRFFLNRQVMLPVELDPAAPLTRTQAVHLLLLTGRMVRPAEPGRVKLPYRDLTQSDPAYNIIATAYGEGWLTADGATAFRPNDSLTRAEFAVWAAGVLGLGELARSGLQTQSGFTDLAGLTTEQRNAANFLAALGMLSPGERFQGDDPITQAEGAALAARLFNYRNR